MGKNKVSLSAFTYATANKYRRGQFEESMGFGFTAHNAILVCDIYTISMATPLKNLKQSDILLGRTLT